VVYLEHWWQTKFRNITAYNPGTRLINHIHEDYHSGTKHIKQIVTKKPKDNQYIMLDCTSKLDGKK